jgi:hypothetical protein
MTKTKTPATVATPAQAQKVPKKLIPRTAPKPVETVVTSAEVPDVAKPEVKLAPVAPPPLPEKQPETLPAKPVASSARPARKPSKEDEKVAMCQKVLAEALVEAQAISYAQPKVMRQEAAKEKKKPAKQKKVKLVRDCFAMPEQEHVRIAEIKKRLSALGHEARKSEVLRGGIALLAVLNDAELKAVMARIDRIKTGRPSK